MRRLFPIIMIMAWRQQFPRRMWWVEPRQYIHHGIVEGDVWHTTPQMLNIRYCSGMFVRANLEGCMMLVNLLYLLLLFN